MRTHYGPPAAHLPRGLLSRISANTDARSITRELADAFGSFKAKHEGMLDNVQAALNEHEARFAALGMNGGGASDRLPPDPSYTKAFGGYFRTGSGEEEVRAACAVGERSKIMAAMQSGSDNAGGYLAPIEWDRTIGQAVRNISPLRRLCDVKVTTTRGYTTVWSDSAWGSGWVGETATRPNTSTPTLSAIVFQPGELYANPMISQQLLDDAAFDIEGWLASEVGITFAIQEGIAFVAGDGQNKPVGFMTHVVGGANAAKHPGGPIQVVMSGAANSITPDGLVDLVYEVPAPYRQGSAWLMNSVTANLISRLKDGQGNYIWRESFQVGQPATLLGYEVAIDENMPAPVAGNIPVAFGNWKLGYVINDRAGARVLRDPYTAKPFVSFYTWKRVGGGVKDPNALRVLQVGTAA